MILYFIYISNVTITITVRVNLLWKICVISFTRFTILDYLIRFRKLRDFICLETDQMWLRSRPAHGLCLSCFSPLVFYLWVLLGSSVVELFIVLMVICRSFILEGASLPLAIVIEKLCFLCFARTANLFLQRPPPMLINITKLYESNSFYQNRVGVLGFWGFGVLRFWEFSLAAYEFVDFAMVVRQSIQLSV